MASVGLAVIAGLAVGRRGRCCTSGVTVMSPWRRRRSEDKAVSVGSMTQCYLQHSAPCIAVLRFKREHQQGNLDVSEQEVNKTIQFKSESNVKYLAVRVPVRRDILAEAADWELQFVMTAPAHNQSKERRLPVEILGGDPVLRPDGVIWSKSSKTVVWIELTSP